jgi:two-component system sensor histidine kinase RegB
MISLLNSFSNNILLSNLVKIRWIAIIGQFFAILLTFFYFRIQILIIPCLFVVAISALVNILSFFIKKRENHLTDKEAFFFLLFDTCQLAILLYLTGGIYNPFSLLLIAPLVISASYLHFIFSVILSASSILIVIIISFFFIEIDWPGEFIVPNLFTYGLLLSFIISLIFIAVYVHMFATSSRNISKVLNQTQIALFNQKKLSEIGSLSAAAVHELSTPLNTIFLILDDFRSNEFVYKSSKIKKEVDLLKSQAERCKNILLKLSENPQNLKDDFFNETMLSDIIKINFDKFNNKNIKLNISILKKDIEPKILFKDELMYGIGNIIQNAIQYSKKEIKVNISWSNLYINIEIIDDGSGFKKEVLDKIGGPYIPSTKKNSMGLGIFIAKNLIENIGGKMYFKNNLNANGSIVNIELNNNILKI